MLELMNFEKPMRLAHYFDDLEKNFFRSSATQKMSMKLTALNRMVICVG